VWTLVVYLGSKHSHRLHVKQDEENQHMFTQITIPGTGCSTTGITKGWTPGPPITLWIDGYCMLALHTSLIDSDSTQYPSLDTDYACTQDDKKISNLRTTSYFGCFLEFFYLLPPRMPQQPDTTFVKESAFIAIQCRRQRRSTQRSSCRVTDIFIQFQPDLDFLTDFSYKSPT
jgi:hypothetical protein